MMHLFGRTKARKELKDREEAKRKYENLRRKMNPDAFQEERVQAPKVEPQPDRHQAMQMADQIFRQQVEETDFAPIFEKHNQDPYFSVFSASNNGIYNLIFHNRNNIISPSPEDKTAFLEYMHWLNSETHSVRLFDLEELMGPSGYSMVRYSSYHPNSLAQEMPLGTYISDKCHCKVVHANVYQNPKYKG